MNGLTVDFAHTSARGKILIKPYPEIADEGNTVGLISESPPCLIQAGPCSAVGGNLLKRTPFVFVSLILNLLVTIQARASAIQAFVALRPSC